MTSSLEGLIQYGNWTGPGYSAGHSSAPFVALSGTDLAVPGVDPFDDQASKPHDIAYAQAQQTLASQWDTQSSSHANQLINYFTALGNADVNFVARAPTTVSNTNFGELVRAFSLVAIPLHYAETVSLATRLQTDAQYATFMSGLTKQQMEDRLSSLELMAADTVLYWFALLNEIGAAVAAATITINELLLAVDNGDDIIRQLATGLAAPQGSSIGSDINQFVQLLEGRQGTIHKFEWASIGVNGQQANSGSLAPTISADGRYVAFHSIASNLVAGDANGYSDIFVHDRQSDATARVSVGLNGAQSNGSSANATISGDGRFIAFESAATNLVQGDVGGYQEIFVYDRTLGTTVRVSMGRNGQGVNNQEPDFPSFHPSIASDGQGNYSVAYASEAGNLVAGDVRGTRDLFIYKSSTHAITQISNGISGAADNTSDHPSIATNGMVAFDSYASNLVANDRNSTQDVFLYTGTVLSRISFGLNGAEANGASSYPSISANGNFVAFESSASNLVAGDTNSSSDIFVYDRTNGTIERVSLTWAGGQADNDSYYPSISGDGRFVAFWSRASNLVQSHIDNTGQAYVYDRQTHQTRLVSVSAAGEVSNSFDFVHPVVSSDGTSVAFDSAASNLYVGASGNSNIFETDSLNFFNSGGPQNDIIRSAVGNDVLDGGRGNNTASYAGIAAAVTVSLAIAGPQNTGGGGTDTLTNFANLIGGSGNDHLTGNQSTNVFTGGPGADTLDGGPGIDTAIFSGPRSAYTLTHSGKSLLVSGRDGPDTLTSIEKLAFDDGTIPSGLNRIPRDFNADTTSDVLWRNNASGHVGVWTMNNAVPTWRDLGGSGVDHKVAGIGDFNNDGTADVFWRNDSSGHVGIWEMHNNAPTWRDLGGSGVDQKVAGVGDFNDDGTADVFWRNDSSGHVGIWEMHNNAPTWRDLGGSGVDHKVAGVGDFNGDGTADVLWRNDTSGHVGIWEMHDNVPTWRDLGGSGVDHKVVGIGDFNGDGTADVLWRNDTTGHVGIWEMHDNVPTWHDLGGSGIDHKIAGIGDYNGDGTSDVFWRNDSNGHAGIWEMHDNVATWRDLGGSGVDHSFVV